MHRECAPWLSSTGRIVIYGFICCIFSYVCKRLCRLGQRLPPAAAQSKGRYCCRRRSAERWNRRSDFRSEYEYQTVSPLRGFLPPLFHSRRRCISRAWSLSRLRLLLCRLPTPKYGRLRSASRRTRRCSNGSFHRNVSLFRRRCAPSASEQPYLQGQSLLYRLHR